MRVLAFLVFAALLTAIIVVQQRISGAYLAEFSATNADEARHFVSGLMVADHLAAGFPPLGPFVEDYALRFPALGFGSNPPLYYGLEGAWFSLLPPSTPAALLLPALLCALLVVGAAWVAARAMGPLPGLAAGAALMAAPALREATIVIGLDLPVALLAFAAALAYAGYLTHGRRRDAILFAVAAAAAMLTKASGLALAFLPPLAVLLGGRFDLLARGAFWLPAPLIALLVAPWYLGVGEGSWAFLELLDPRALSAGIAARAALVLDGIGSAFAVLGGIGALFAIVRGWRRVPGSAPLVAVSALAGAYLVFFLFFADPADPARLLPLLPAVAILSAYGTMGLLGLITSDWATMRGLLVALVLLLAALPGLLEPVEKPGDGMDEAAQSILSRDRPQPVVMVGADAKGEGAFIAAMAQHDRLRRSYVVRGSVQPAIAVASAGPDMGALLARLKALAVDFLALDTSKGAQAEPAARNLMAAVEAHPDRFDLVGTYSRGDGAGEVRVYALPSQGGMPVDPEEMKRRLGASDS